MRRNEVKMKMDIKIIKNRIFGLVLAMAVVTLTGCGQSGNDVQQPDTREVRDETAQSMEADTGGETLADQNADTENTGDLPEEAGGIDEPAENQEAEELTVRFGDEGDPFILHLYDNDTAAAIARHVGTADWRLPIYHYEGYENWEVMQYYDVPSRYEIPSDPESVTEEAAGTVYYSEPNRIVLFYGDAQVSGEYTPVGYFDDTEEFRSAVENNPVLEGWDTKMVNISK